jgi:hypothetical protein
VAQSVEDAEFAAAGRRLFGFTYCNSHCGRQVRKANLRDVKALTYVKARSNNIQAEIRGDIP